MLQKLVEEVHLDLIAEVMGLMMISVLKLTDRA